MLSCVELARVDSDVSSSYPEPRKARQAVAPHSSDLEQIQYLNIGQKHDDGSDEKSFFQDLTHKEISLF